MAQISINEISQNYAYNVGNTSFATVALPITACWGPAYTSDIGFITDGEDREESLENIAWTRFPSTQKGLEAFVSAYRGPATIHRLAGDYSYQQAMTLLTSGYDVLVCRVSPGSKANVTLTETISYIPLESAPEDWSTKYKDYFEKANNGGYVSVTGDSAPSFSEDKYYKYKEKVNTGNKVLVTAKYPGTFGNKIWVYLKPVPNKPGIHNLIVYVQDDSGVRSAVENLVFTFDQTIATDSILYVDEVKSDFIDLSDYEGVTSEGIYSYSPVTGDTVYDSPVQLSGAKDMVEYEDGYIDLKAKPADWSTNYKSYYTKNVGSEGKVTYSQVTGSSAPEFSESTYYQFLGADKLAIRCAAQFADFRYDLSGRDKSTYPNDIKDLKITDKVKANIIAYNEWLYSAAFTVYDCLKDKLSYNPQRIISPGWDDQNVCAFKDLSDGEDPIKDISPLHWKLMEVAYYSRCATSYLDVPKSLPRKKVHNESMEENKQGYAQRLARYVLPEILMDGNELRFHTCSALFGPWGHYVYAGTSKQAEASPSFITLLIERAMILNQPIRYEWALPESRKHNLNIGELSYRVPKKMLDQWQTLEGASVNVITNIPGIGVTVWGNSTLYEVPAATYQALANLSTRKLVNAVEDLVYTCGTAITFQYNNDQAYNKFYAGVTPLLDTMKNVGAIDNYYIKMSADISGLDQVNANTVIGKIYLVINGVVNDIKVDLIALPPGTDLNQYATQNA